MARKGAGLFDRAKTMAMQTPLGQAASQAAKDYRSLVNSPAASMARQAYGIPPPTTGYAGRSAVPVARPVPVATPVPVARPVPVAATPSLNPNEISLATLFLLGQNNESYRQQVADRAIAQVAGKKNRDANLALLDGIGKLATEVKDLVASGTPMGTTAKISGVQSPGVVAQMLPMLQDPAVRSRVAMYLATAKEPAPNERRFLAGSINQLATAIRIGMQQKLMLGGKTRRRRRVSRRSPSGGK